MQAKVRLADEYDAAQERGEVQAHGGQGKRDVPQGNIPSVADLGLTRKAVHEARQLRDAEAADPGVIRRALDARLDAGQEPITVSTPGLSDAPGTTASFRRSRAASRTLCPP